MINPWFNSYENFKYHCALVASRAYKAKLEDYERTKGVTLAEMPKGAKHKKLLEKLNKEMTLSCLIPFFDLCNLRTPTGKDEKVDFILHWDKGGVGIGLDDTFVPDKEYDYSYVPSPSNDKLIFVYGFYIENNPHSQVSVILTLMRTQFSVDKYRFCKELKCVDIDLEGFYQSTFDKANLQVSLGAQGPLNETFLNLMRVYVYNPETFVKDKDLISGRLLAKKWLSYENEVRATLLYKDFVKFHLAKMKLNLVSSRINPLG
jgi:hypothetical protein